MRKNCPSAPEDLEAGRYGIRARCSACATTMQLSAFRIGRMDRLPTESARYRLAWYEDPVRAIVSVGCDAHVRFGIILSSIHARVGLSSLVGRLYLGSWQGSWFQSSLSCFMPVRKDPGRSSQEVPRRHPHGDRLVRIVGGPDQSTFHSRTPQAAQMESSEAARLLDLSEDRFSGDLAPPASADSSFGNPPPTLRRPQSSAPADSGLCPRPQARATMIRLAASTTIRPCSAGRNRAWTSSGRCRSKRSCVALWLLRRRRCIPAQAIAVAV